MIEDLHCRHNCVGPEPINLCSEIQIGQSTDFMNVPSFEDSVFVKGLKRNFIAFLSFRIRLLILFESSLIVHDVKS